MFDEHDTEVTHDRRALSGEFINPGHYGGAASRQTLALAALVAVVIFGGKALDVLGRETDVVSVLAAVLTTAGAVAGALYHPVARFWWRGAIAGVVVVIGVFLAHQLHASVRTEPSGLEFAVVALLGATPGVFVYYLLMRHQVVGQGT